MNKFQRLEDGEKTDADDPDRGLWYSACCSYWTDDWTKLKGSLPPTCPHCRSVGFQTTAGKWFSGAEKYEGEGHPHFLEFINLDKERCVAATAEERYQNYLRQRSN